MTLLTSLKSLGLFALYLASASALLWVFVQIYVRFTPYKEFELIAGNNNAAAISLSGAILGFTLPLASSIYFTRSVLEMLLWGSITCVVQLGVFVILRKQAKAIEQGQTAPAIFLAAASVSVGLLNAVCISY